MPKSPWKSICTHAQNRALINTMGNSIFTDGKFMCCSPYDIRGAWETFSTQFPCICRSMAHVPLRTRKFILSILCVQGRGRDDPGWRLCMEIRRSTNIMLPLLARWCAFNSFPPSDPYNANAPNREHEVHFVDYFFSLFLWFRIWGTWYSSVLGHSGVHLNAMNWCVECKTRHWVTHGTS